jgi:hypothetical protein
MLTRVTTLSRAVDPPPPNDMLATLGRPELLAELRTKSNPAMLQPKDQLTRGHDLRKALNMSEIAPPPRESSTLTAMRFAAFDLYRFQQTKSRRSMETKDFGNAPALGASSSRTVCSMAIIAEGHINTIHTKRACKRTPTQRLGYRRRSLPISRGPRILSARG